MGLTRTGRFSMYDGERLWKQYMSWGAAATHKKLRGWVESVGMCNPEIGRPSQMGPFFAMWRWAIRNPEEAYPHYKSWWFETDPLHCEPSYEDFLKDLRKHAINASMLSVPAYRKFCEKHGLSTVAE